MSWQCSWARSAALHEGWYQRVLERHALRTGVSRAEQAERTALSCDLSS
ncbi:hypothetical protein [Ideonella azotifigens]|nr:hypothetical protein [Ideonella azotifigens]